MEINPLPLRVNIFFVRVLLLFILRNYIIMVIINSITFKFVSTGVYVYGNNVLVVSKTV